ncbi:MAG: hypothetical protein Q7T68_12560, partial [Sphingopyxis sp.]|nr:hypothetical protein [Sphingopyxis sp.]
MRIAFSISLFMRRDAKAILPKQWRRQFADQASGYATAANISGSVVLLTRSANPPHRAAQPL